jgi:hypothetical protein
MPTTITTAPTLSQVLGAFLQNAIDNPKTTIQGLLSAVYAVTLYLLSVKTLSPKVAGLVLTLNTIAKVGLAMSMKDGKAGIQLPAGTSVQQATQTTVLMPPADATIPPKP